MKTRSQQKILNGETGKMMTHDLYSLNVSYESRVEPNKTEKDFWEIFFKYGLNAYNSRKNDWLCDFINNEHFKDLVSVVLQLKAMHIDQSKIIEANQVQIKNNNT